MLDREKYLFFKGIKITPGTVACAAAEKRNEGAYLEILLSRTEHITSPCLNLPVKYRRCP